jgi:hypothetical protein
MEWMRAVGISSALRENLIWFSSLPSLFSLFRAAVLKRTTVHALEVEVIKQQSNVPSETTYRNNFHSSSLLIRDACCVFTRSHERFRLPLDMSVVSADHSESSKERGGLGRSDVSDTTFASLKHNNLFDKDDAEVRNAGVEHCPGVHFVVIEETTAKDSAREWFVRLRSWRHWRPCTS